MSPLKKGLYRGYSSYEYQRAKTFKLTDVELVKMDLLNHLFTRRGERVKMPTFGTRIPDLPFEPLDQVTMDILEEDFRSVIAFDPRVKLISMTVTPDYDNATITASATLLYIELNVTDGLDINITMESV